MKHDLRFLAFKKNIISRYITKKKIINKNY